MKLANEIKKRMKEEGLSVNAWAINNKIAPQKVHGWLKGELPIVDTLKKLSKALGKSLDEIVELIEQEHIRDNYRVGDVVYVICRKIRSSRTCECGRFSGNILTDPCIVKVRIYGFCKHGDSKYIKVGKSGSEKTEIDIKYVSKDKDSLNSRLYRGFFRDIAVIKKADIVI